MSLMKEKIERIFGGKAKECKFRKNQMNRYIRRQKIGEDDVGGKTGRKPTRGWEY